MHISKIAKTCCFLINNWDAANNLVTALINPLALGWHEIFLFL